MSFSQGNTNEGMHQDAQVNIASIIDCFTVLITYVLAAASFISLGAIDTGIAGAPLDTGSAQVAVTSLSKIVTLHLNITESSQVEVKSNVEGQHGNETVNESTILARVNDFKARHPDLKSVTLSAIDSIPYERMVKIIAGLRESKLPIIFSGNPD